MIENGWKEWFLNEQKQPYFKELMEFVEKEYKEKEVYPPYEQIFQAFEVTDLDDIKVVILGQDPYHQKNQAHGFCFSVNKGVKVPPSLRNIYKELHDDIGFVIPDHGNLMEWAKQGVFLNNACLTVVDSTPKAHANKGWEIFTDHAIQKINEKDTPVVFLLWGKDARSKKKYIDTKKHLVLEAAHPSPLSAYRGFFGCKHFSKCNEFLIKNHLTPIDWSISNESFN